MLIYLACPYSHLSVKVKAERYKFVTRVTGWLMQNGEVVYSPITHSHAVEDCWDSEPRGWDFWQTQDLEMIARCNEYRILAIPGWTISVGVTDETRFALEQGKSVTTLRRCDLPSDLRAEWDELDLIVQREEIL